MIILETFVGSKALGLNLPEKDDTDLMAISFASKRELIGIGNKEWTKVERTKPEGVKSEPGDVDRVIYSLNHWVKLLLKGNPTVLLPLFVDESMIVKSTSLGISIRQKFPEALVAKSFYEPFMGYLTAQKQRLYGERGQMRVKRTELIEKFGYDTKYAMHAIRLGLQGIELLLTGRLKCPMIGFPQDLLMRVRTGEFTYDQIWDLLMYTEERLKAARDKSKLRDKPDVDTIEKLLMLMNLGVIMGKEGEK